MDNFKDTTGNSDYLGRIRYWNSDNKFVFSTNTSDKIVVDSNGKVGIALLIPVLHYVKNTNTSYNASVIIDGPSHSYLQFLKMAHQ